MNGTFEKTISEILRKNFGDKASDIEQVSPLIQYLVKKTKSAQSGSKARGSFANLYAIYVLLEDYINNGYVDNGDYEKYEGAQFSKLFQRQRELPFGRKLQNHALNHRLNEEFKKFFPTVDQLPILRDPSTNRYWFNENLVRLQFDGTSLNIAITILEIIDEYVKAKTEAFEGFLKDFNDLISLSREQENFDKTRELLLKLLEPNVDARIFEIVSFSILKAFYKDTVVYFGFSREDIKEEPLKLYKTGRTNANDGGIDFVMRPLGRFFQVTETLDVRKYFLDIDKIERYPITFVIKTELEEHEIYEQLQSNAKKYFPIDSVVKKYMNSIEEVINIKKLHDYVDKVIDKGDVRLILNEVIVQSKVEFNYEDGAITTL